MNYDTVLMGTFLLNNRVPRYAIRDIFETFDSSKVFIFQIDSESLEEKNKFLLTFNITKAEREDRLNEYMEKYRNTIQLHRRKEHNTFYTINSLNKIVERQNKGERDQNFKVDWSEFDNCCLVSNEEQGLKILKIKLYDIVNHLEN